MAWRRFKEFSGQGLRKGSFAGLCNFIVYAGGGGGGFREGSSDSSDRYMWVNTQRPRP